MFIIAHDGQTTIMRVQRYRNHSGRFLMLKKSVSSNAMYSTSSEFGNLSDAKRRLLDRTKITGQRNPMDALFDMLTQDMWIYDSKSESAKKIYDIEDQWVDG